jgi:hypothetical protein
MNLLEHAKEQQLLKIAILREIPIIWLVTAK